MNRQVNISKVGTKKATRKISQAKIKTLLSLFPKSVMHDQVK